MIFLKMQLDTVNSFLFLKILRNDKKTENTQKFKIEKLLYYNLLCISWFYFLLNILSRKSWIIIDFDRLQHHQSCFLQVNYLTFMRRKCKQWLEKNVSPDFWPICRIQRFYYRFQWTSCRFAYDPRKKKRCARSYMDKTCLS